MSTVTLLCLSRNPLGRPLQANCISTLHKAARSQQRFVISDLYHSPTTAKFKVKSLVLPDCHLVDCYKLP